MTHSDQRRGEVGGIDLWMTIAALAVAILMIVAATQVQAQTFTVLHSFTGGADGDQPTAGLTLDRAGNLYGTTTYGGTRHAGAVFKLAHSGAGWVLYPLYSFQGSADGGNPNARVVFGPDGSLYGTTTDGTPYGYGSVFNLRPPVASCRASFCPWTVNVLYSFTGHADGGAPEYGDLVFDSTGNIYGTTSAGGLQSCGGGSCGVVFRLAHSNGGWTESPIYSFTGGNDGYEPYSGVIFDNAGNLYGTTFEGGANFTGTVYELTLSGAGWRETTLSSFVGESGYPFGGVILDQQGNLYGTTIVGGTAFELQPDDGSWAYTLLHTFTGYAGPAGSLTRDAAGNLYGTSEGDGLYQNGTVFKLTPSNGGWAYTDLHDFTGGRDGGFPVGSVAVDSQGNLYGTANSGGSDGGGVVWQITP